MKLIRELKPVYATTDRYIVDHKVSSSTDSAKYLRDYIFNAGLLTYREEFNVLFLNRANRIISHQHISEGGISGTLCDPKVIFSGALIAGASAIILAHNHPSGNTNPSESDKKLTDQLVKAGKTLEITVLDHIILTELSHYSFADEGLI